MDFSQHEQFLGREVMVRVLYMERHHGENQGMQPTQPKQQIRMAWVTITQTWLTHFHGRDSLGHEHLFTWDEIKIWRAKK